MSERLSCGCIVFLLLSWTNEGDRSAVALHVTERRRACELLRLESCRRSSSSLAPSLCFLPFTSFRSHYNTHSQTNTLLLHTPLTPPPHPPHHPLSNPPPTTTALTPPPLHLTPTQTKPTNSTKRNNGPRSSHSLRCRHYPR